MQPKVEQSLILKTHCQDEFFLDPVRLSVTLVIPNHEDLSCQTWSSIIEFDFVQPLHGMFTVLSH